MKSIIKKLLREGLNESAIGKTLIVVDIQPEYQNAFGNMHHDLFEYINENYNEISNLIFLYNGESLAMVSESDFRYWMLESGLNEDIAFNTHTYDKGYAFFRYCMDEGIDHEQTVNLIKHMIANNVHDSRDLNKEFWDSFISEYGNTNIRELLEFSDDAIYIPDLMDELKPLNNIVLVGGGINECLKEVEIALDALDKPYQTWSQYTY